MAQPQDFLTQAIKLQSSASCDADYRTVIDRAYYGAYHAASEFEERLPHRSNATVQNAGSHEALLVRLERPHEHLEYALKVISKDIGAQLRQLKPLRELATYATKETIRVDQAEAAIRGAREIFEECTRGSRKLSARTGQRS